jgi:hypothetical protein
MKLKRTVARLSVVAGNTLAAGCAAHPVHDRILQTGFCAGAALVWVGLLALMDGRGRLKVIVLALPLLALVPFVLPGKPIDPDFLRADYVKRMRGFEHTKYVWGGENALGIDCSGLPRRALRDALWSEGLHRANGSAFRMWLEQWWFDSSARAMSQGYRGRTRSLGVSGPLWELDKAPLLPGDLAVRTDGRHVVIYLGDHRWIEADPGRGKVRSWRPAPADGPWYDPMTLHRWVITEPLPR